MIPASKYFSTDEVATIELTEEEEKLAENIKVKIWWEKNTRKWNLF